MKLRTNIIICLCVFAISVIVVQKIDFSDDLALYEQGTNFFPSRPDSAWFVINGCGFNLQINDIGPGSKVTIGDGKGQHETIVSQVASYGFNSEELILYIRDIYGNYFHIDRTSFSQTREIPVESIYFDKYRWVTPSDIENPHSEINSRRDISWNFTILCILSFFTFYFFLNIAILRRLKVNTQISITLSIRIPLMTLVLCAVLVASNLSYSLYEPTYTDIKTENINLEMNNVRLVVFRGDTLFLSSEKTYPDSIFYLSNVPVYNPATGTDSVQGMQADLWAYNDSNIVFRSEDIWYKIKSMSNADNNSYIVVQKCEDKIEDNDSYMVVGQPKYSTEKGNTLDTILLFVVVFWFGFELFFSIAVLVASIFYKT